MDFMEVYCERCVQNRQWPLCEIQSASMTFLVSDVGYPAEWVCDDDGRNPRCLSFEWNGIEPALREIRRQRWGHLRALWLFLRIVWRPLDGGGRLDWRTAWQIAKGIHRD
jgi:hypothetical protein